MVVNNKNEQCLLREKVCGGKGGGHNIGLGKAFNENELYSKHFKKLALNFSVE